MSKDTTFNKKFHDIKMIGDVAMALNELSEYLGVDITLQFPTEDALQKHKALKKEYSAFYKLSIKERFEYSKKEVKDD